MAMPLSPPPLEFPMTVRSLIRLALALFPTGLLGAQATVFKHGAGVTGDVWVYPAPGQAGTPVPELQEIVLLPVDATGRTPYGQFLGDQPRLESDVPFASRIVLPQGQGSLYRYRQPGPGGTQFGYFLVRPSGLASFVASFPGSGLDGSGDPIPDPVAVTRQGDALLVSTTPEAGGDLFEIELATGTVRSFTANLPPLDFLREGLILLPHWGAALTTRGPLRFVRGGRPLLVPLVPKARSTSRGIPSSGPLAYYGTGLVASADGTTVAMIAGVAPDQAHVFTFRLGGAAVCVNDQPGTIAHPGFGTEAAPMLALSSDGRRAAWKTYVLAAGELTGECFSREVSELPTLPEFQITADAHFTDTLNDTGVISFFGEKVMMIVGEANGAGGVEKGDFYQATFSAGGGAPVFTNLTNTSGDGAVPFLSKGDIETSDGVFLMPNQSGLVYYVDGPSGQGEYFRLNAANGNVSMIRSGVAGVDFIERAGASFVLGILHDQPSQRELIRVPFDHAAPATSLGVFPVLETFASHAGNAAGTFASVQNVTGGQRLFQIDAASGNGIVLAGTAPFGPTLGFDGGGNVLAAPKSATAAYFISWSPLGSVTLYGTGPTSSYVLPAE